MRLTTFCTILLALVIIAHEAFCQTFTGGVAAMRFVPPSNVANVFLLFGQEVIGAPNEFHYGEGKFDLSFTDATDAPYLCSGGCTLNASIEQWYTPQSIGGCTITSATLDNGTYTQGGYMAPSGKWVPMRTFANVKALFSQTYCVEKQNHYYSGGTLTVQLQ